ncbi:malto-oligosyltrehalose synthase [Novosphingobium gossypii]|uniref:malto-oligosyltrehalose synthase n=1 Tax=Novosphingobium gossypii TaxID=1604774 RepID=UPI003D2052E2
MPDTTPPLIATYRLQLREGTDLAAAQALLPRLVDLGISHLYLSPPFEAAPGSTHGYDVTDPTRIDPALGGDAAFEALADAAQEAGIGIVVDIVPNHMAFVPENPFLADVMRHGRESVHAPVFDIDWDAGPLHFPVLDGEPDDLLAAGQIAIAGSAEDPCLSVYGRRYPLRQTELSSALADGDKPLDREALTALLAEQHWSLGHWQSSADRIVHRRFFNITDLIGVRQEDPAVFALTHGWILAQVEAGRIQGLRVDHVDGLARPGSYLNRLRGAVGDTPIWVEKIVKADEALPAAWPVEGMSGYEFMTPVTRLMTHEEGLAALREAAEGAVPRDYAQEVRKVRRELLDQVFVPELRRVANAAMVALAAKEEALGDVHEAVCVMATAWPVYRSYAADLLPPATVPTLGDTPYVSDLLALLRAPDDPAARAFAARFEQLTGALTAKSEEDTVFFRSFAYPPLCEVGAEPDLGVIDAEAFLSAMAARAAQTPMALNALSTHDTKRSADARAVLIALTHFPDLCRSVYAEARRRAIEEGLAEGWGIYALQTALMLQGQPDAEARIEDHVAKAMREGKEYSRHEEPDEQAEAAVARLSQALHHQLSIGGLLPRNRRQAFTDAVETIVLAQATLQLTAPGLPDIYQGTEKLAVGLTDPDNRRPVDHSDTTAGSGTTSLSSRKLALTRSLLARRRENPDLFTRGEYVLSQDEDAWTVHRSWQGQTFNLRIPRVSVMEPVPQQH